MKKIVIISFAFALAILLSGCGQKTAQPSILDQVKGQQAAQNLGQALQTGNTNDVQNSLQNIAELGAQYELKEFESTESVDAPKGFPKDLIYSSGKITEASDSSSDSYTDLNVTVKTTDELSKVKDFYKNALASSGWKITSQSNTSTGASFDATASNGFTVNIYINRESYSKLTEAQISYTGTISE